VDGRIGGHKKGSFPSHLCDPLPHLGKGNPCLIEQTKNSKYLYSNWGIGGHKEGPFPCHLLCDSLPHLGKGNPIMPEKNNRKLLSKPGNLGVHEVDFSCHLWNLYKHLLNKRNRNYHSNWGIGGHIPCFICDPLSSQGMGNPPLIRNKSRNYPSNILH